MPLPTTTTGGSGRTRSEAAIEAWKHRQRAAKPGALDPKVAARVKEILASKIKGKKKAAPKGKKAPDPAKAKAKADALAKRETAKKQREQAKVDRAGKQLSAATARETAKRTKVAERATAMAKKQQAQQKKLKQAAQAKKEKAKAAQGKQAAGAAKKEAADPAKKQAANREKVAKDMADSDSGLSPSGSTALSNFADGKPLAEETAKQFEDMGLTETGSDGTHRLTSEGKQAAAAMSKGDTRGTMDAISRAADKKKAKGDAAPADDKVDKADREQGDLLASVADNPKKLGFRQSGDLERAGLIEKTKDGFQLTDAGKAKIAKRQKQIDDAKAKASPSSPPEKARKALDMSDLAIKAGARHSKMDASHLDEAARHLHSAGATCPDCAPDDTADGGDDAVGGDAEKAIKSIMDNPAWYAQHECNDIMQAGSALSTVAMLIQSELSEEDEDDADIAQLVDAARVLITFIGSELDELEGAAGDAAAGRTAGDVPMAKGIELAHLDSGEDIAIMRGGAIKSIGDTGLVGGWLVKYGGDGDLSQFRDVFTKATNYGKHTKSDVWVHHRMLPGLGKKGFTNQADLSMENEGVFFKHLLDLRNAYEAKYYNMVKDGKLGLSSGTAPHLVERKAMGDGRHEITQWTLGLDASYTPMPAGGFVVNAGAMKSLLDEAGIDLLNALYIDDSPEANETKAMRHDGAEMGADDRARRLMIQQRMIHLREIVNGSTS